MYIQNQKGFTIVEILIASVLGLFLTAVIISIYVGNQNTFRSAQGVARSQETTRFATHFLKTDIRQAGYQGCSKGVSKRPLLDSTNDSFSPSVEGAIFGWEFNNTSVGDNYTLDYETLDTDFTQGDVDTARENNSSPGSEWSSQFIQGIPGTLTSTELPQSIADLNPISGSDIVVLSISDTFDLFVQRQSNQRATTLTTINQNGAIVPSGIDRGSIISVGDCSSIDIFQNGANAGDSFLSIENAGNIQPGNDLNNTFQWQKRWDENASIYTTNTILYYIGTGARGIPSLYRYTTTCGLDGNCGATAAELIEGVETMQILYGVDTTRNGAANTYVSADDVPDFRDVVAVKAGLLIRSPEAANVETGNGTFTILDQIQFDPPDDRFQRYVNNTTIRLQNSGL